MTDVPTSIRFDGKTIAYLDGAVSSTWTRTAVIRRTIERYREICRRELAALDLSEAEWDLLRDGLNGVWHEPARSIGALHIGVRDSIELDGLATKRGVDGPALVAKLEGLSYAGCVAVVDAVERWWASRP